MKQLFIIATGNKGKIREIRDIITDPEADVLSMREAGVSADPEETGTTFEENALIKARAVCDRRSRRRTWNLLRPLSRP